MLGNIGIWQLLIVLVIVMVVFGTKKIRGMGSDIGGAVSGFKKAMKEGAEEADKEQIENQADATASKVEETTDTKA